VIASIEAGRAELAERIRTDPVDETLLLPYFARQVAQETQMMEGALGTLAWRTFSSTEEVGK